MIICWLAYDCSEKCLVVDERNYIGENIYCKDVDGIHVYQLVRIYFIWKIKEVWGYVKVL
ncbi:hypothetical protein [Bacteroides acidifaciens]|uniref:hypothetical protein n=1 Tax=Bacteroides acidifaciens TaxID=85831 RepID=UPI001C3FAF15|nr:hypothetical protein [Bacteroides acidifaciens]